MRNLYKVYLISAKMTVNEAPNKIANNFWHESNWVTTEGSLESL